MSPLDKSKNIFSSVEKKNKRNFSATRINSARSLGKFKTEKKFSKLNIAEINIYSTESNENSSLMDKENSKFNEISSSDDNEKIMRNNRNSFNDCSKIIYEFSSNNTEGEEEYEKNANVNSKISDMNFLNNQQRIYRGSFNKSFGYTNKEDDCCNNNNNNNNNFDTSLHFDCKNVNVNVNLNKERGRTNPNIFSQRKKIYPEEVEYNLYNFNNNNDASRNINTKINKNNKKSYIDQVKDKIIECNDDSYMKSKFNFYYKK